MFVECVGKLRRPAKETRLVCMLVLVPGRLGSCAHGGPTKNKLLSA